MGTCGIDFNAHGVHTAHDHIIQAPFQFALIDIMLVLANPDGLRVDLYQFRKRIHQASSDGDGAPNRDIMIGEFLAGHAGSGIDGCPAFIHHDDLNAFRKIQAADKGFRFSPGGAVAYGNGFNAELSGKRPDPFGRLG